MKELRNLPAEYTKQPGELSKSAPPNRCDANCCHESDCIITEYGKITLRAKLLQSRGERLWLRFEVEDTGMGIAAESLPNLFEAFAQGDASTTRRHGGTGLGLTITRRLAQMMEGDVGVASEVGQGSRFWFDVWLRRAAPPQQADQRTAQTASPGLTAEQHNAPILLVEDHPINREVIAELLHSAELQVEPAGRGPGV